MTFNIRQLDNLDYDDIEPILDDYIGGAIEQFAHAPEGEAYGNTHDDFGGWIGTFIEMAYVYGEFKLPTMGKGDVQSVIQDILPRKLTLLDPSEADTAIPELVAFWEFLKREYTLRSAGAIIKYLKGMESKFPAMMSDPAAGGFAKQFLMSGQAAGFDMTTEEGVKAYQNHHNTMIQETGVNPFTGISNSGVPGAPSPGGILNMLLGNAPPPNTTQSADLQSTDLEKLTSMIGAIASGDLSSLRAPASDTDFWEGLRAASIAHDLEPLSDEAIALLTKQTITETEPGTILHDFQALLNFIGGKGISVSSKLKQFPAKAVITFNEQLSNPIQVDLKRPVQKSYPPVHGLYMLLRATGLGQITGVGKKRAMCVNLDVLESWNQLTPTEKYFNLLEAWLIRSHGEILGDSHAGGINEGSRCLQSWPRLAEKTQTYKSYAEQQTLNYFPEYHNLALMEMFGFLQIKSGKPDTDKGWRVKQIKVTPFGNVMMNVVGDAYVQQGMIWDSESNPILPFGELRPAFQAYFPDWENNLEFPSHVFRPGIHTFKVSLGKIWRRIEISGHATLFDLSRLILKSVDYDSDHLDMFTYKSVNGRTIQISHPYSDEPPFSDEIQIGDVPITEGTGMQYVFDFGDWWEFEVQLETVQPNTSQPSHGEIIKAHGEAPEQYR